jgi:hypothetical protein
MYIVGGHMDGHGFGAALNDDGSGTALVMELARVFSSPDVSTDRSVRFILWNNEETGLNGARAYVAQRQALQGIENPKGSGKYPEPKWLGMIQHDMMMWDHGMPGPDGKVSAEQRREADVNIEFAGTSKFADEAQKMAWFFRRSNDKYATDYPAAVGDRMSNTDSDPFKDRLEPHVASADRCLLDFLRQGFSPRTECRADDAFGRRAACRRRAQVAARKLRNPYTSKFNALHSTTDSYFGCCGGVCRHRFRASAAAPRRDPAHSPCLRDSARE